MLEELNRISFLYDFYSFFLTDKQQKAIELYYFNNFSLGEIALEYNISRQGVYDLLRRAVHSLEEIETRMQLFSRYNYRKEKLQDALNIVSQDNLKNINIKNLKEIIEELLEENEN